ncbi:MAG: hypothetical protein SNJ52_01980, partial [Verrucomicrobiia bacterium]
MNIFCHQRRLKVLFGVSLSLICHLPVAAIAQDLQPPDAEAILNPQISEAPEVILDHRSVPFLADVVGEPLSPPPLQQPSNTGQVFLAQLNELGSSEASDAPANEIPPTTVSGPAGAYEPVDPPIQDNIEVPINILWVLICGFLVMLMQSGFAMVETGFTRAKNVAHTMAMNFMVYAVGMLGYWLCGFAIQMGGTGAPGSVSTVLSLGEDVGSHLNQMIGFEIDGKYFGLLGNAGYMLAGDFLYGGVFALFLFQMMFMDTAATIPTGTMAERWSFLSFLLASFFTGAVVYPIFACWVWGGGWLAALGVNYGLGHGHVDFAGSSVVHLTGGMLALVGGALLGARYGKYNRDGSANPIPGHNLSMGFIGTFILAFGWFGFNAGSTLSGLDPQIGIIAANTMLAGAAGAVGGMTTAWLLFKKPDPSFMCNGLLAGLVSVTAGCPFVDAWMAVTIGLIGGVVVVFSALFIERRLRIDDPVGAISVHGVCGIWGCLAVGIFANGKYGDGWNGVEGNVAGLIAGDSTQIVAQIVGISTCILSFA